jgi:hypothetical protein
VGIDDSPLWKRILGFLANDQTSDYGRNAYPMIREERMEGGPPFWMYILVVLTLAGVIALGYYWPW